MFATNALTDDFNDKKLTGKSLPQPHYAISATDSKRDTLTGQVTITMPKKISDTGGLKETLVLAKGARVMLTNNLDVSDRLVNGGRGVVMGFELDKNG